jgi:Ca2+-binding RTX toxin-like protein
MARSTLVFRIATVSVLAVSTLGAVSAAPANAAEVTCAGLKPTIVGTAGRDHLTGTDGDDVIVGLDSSDVIDGGGGDDVICGNRGADRLLGAAGDDQVYGQKADDQVGGGDGRNIVDGGSGTGTRFVTGPGNDHYRAASEEVEIDYLQAPGPVSIDLGAGSASGWGRDTFDFGRSYVVVDGSGYADTLLGSERDESLNGGPDGGAPGDADTIHGRGGDDLLVAHQGFLAGGGGDDSLSLLDLADSASTLVGGSGGDMMQVTRLSDGFHFAGGKGRDRLHLEQLVQTGAAGPFTFDMTAGTLDGNGRGGGTASGFESLVAIPESFEGWTSFDIGGTDRPDRIIVVHTHAPVTVRGLAGDDVMRTTSGDDTLLGGAGDDTADAGGGNNTCLSIEHPRRC